MSSSEATTYVTTITCEQMKNAEDYLQEYVLAWLDTAIDDDGSNLDVSLGLLRTIQQVTTFNNSNKCFEYLSSITEKRAFLILSCTIDQNLLSDFLALPQLEYIYIFGKETILKKEQSKLVEVTSIQTLYNHLSGNSRYSTEEENDTDFASLTSEAIAKSIQDFNGDARIFIFYQLLIEILLRLPKTPEIREQFFSFCMEKTNDNRAQQTIFQKRMENYTPDQAISWYTDTSFFHKLLNRTCRLGNIKDMFKLAFFMVDLNAQLKILHDEYFNCYAEQEEVYRGRPMSTLEFNKLQSSIGDLVVTKSFLSATKEKHVAYFYSGAGTQKPDFVPAILHMIINKQRNETKSFARVRYSSQIIADDEILISIGTIFRIIGQNHEKDIHEFTLFRGDEEKDVECKIENAFREKAKESNAFFHLDSSTDAKECCEQIHKILTSSDDQITKSLGDRISSNIEEKMIPGSELTVKDSVEWQHPTMGRRLNRISKELKKLEEVKDIFILDRGPMYGTSLASPGPNPVSSKSSEEIIIEGRILPKLEPYCQRSFRIRITLLPEYPFEPPKLHLLDRTYHPNIDINGKLCIRLVNGYDGYNPAVSLADIIQKAEQLISSFDEELVINFDAYEKYRNDRDEFNRKTLDFILCYGHPRT